MTFGMGSSTVDSDYCGNYFGSAGTAAEKNSLYNYHCTAVCVWVGPGSLHGTDDAFLWMRCGASRLCNSAERWE